MMCGVRRLTPVLALAAAALVSAAAPALAGPPVGVDVSAPQAGAVLPGDAAFGVVGVNGATFATLNPDFARQWQTWAVGRPGGAPQVYVLSANPGQAGASWGQPGPSGACDGSSGDPDCARDYGYHGAARALAAAAGVVTSPVTWWVDVEGGVDGPTWDRDRTDLNRAVLAGELEGLRTRPDLVARVGIYTRAATPGQRSDFETIMGSGSAFAGLPVWLATGERTAAGAAHVGCGLTGPSGGPVVQVQSPGTGGGLDTDAVCPPRVVLPAGVRAVTGPAGRTVTVRGTGLPGTRIALTATDLRAARPRLTRTVVVGPGGTWSTGLPLAADGRLALAAADGQAAGVDLRPAAQVAITVTAPAARACTSTVRGSTGTFYAGERVQLRTGRRTLASGPVHRSGSAGSWSLTLPGTCGPGLRVSAYVDGRGTGGRVVTEPGTSRVALVRRS